MDGGAKLSDGFQRAYDLLRTYVNRERERLESLDVLHARRELEDSLRRPGQPEYDLPTPKPQEPEEDPKVRARKVLGVGEDASFEEIRRSFERLNKRSDPSQFPEGTPEREGAEMIHNRVNWAYKLLSEDVGEVAKRFGSLELD